MLGGTGQGLSLRTGEILAGDGNDTIDAGDGADVADPGAGRDSVSAGTGDDHLSLAAGEGRLGRLRSGRRHRGRRLR